MKIISIVFLSLFFSLNAFSRDLQPVVLPDDEGTHDFNIEWWYYTGHLETVGPDGPRKFAFEMTVFKGAAIEPISGYVAHFAFIDLDKRKHVPFECFNPFASQLPPAPSRDGFKFIFEQGKWLVEGQGGHDRLKAETKDYSIDLELTSIKVPALFGDEGIVDYGAAGKLAYYSRTRMLTSGSVRVPDEHGAPKNYVVTGMTWMDHQWGPAGIPNKMGWDWFSVQLDNFNDFMIFQVRDQRSKEIINTAGFIVDAKNQVIKIQGELIDIRAVNPNAAIYPTEWTIKVPAPFDIDFHIRARFPEQRFKVPAQLTPVYWEGSCLTRGKYQGVLAKGRGFTEMAGYE